MDQARLQALLEQVKGKTVGVIGDFCLDAYWTLDPDCDELSVETGKPVHRVLEHRYSPGGASNVTANLAALDVGCIKAFGVIGPDVFGQELQRQLSALGIDCAGLLTQEERWNTPVFAKPHLGEEEQCRFDFGTVNEIAPETEHALLEGLRDALSTLDALIINQQLPKGYHSDAVISALNELAAANPPCPILVDARDKSGAFTGVLLKINAIEAAELCGEARDINRAISLADLERYAKVIHARNQHPVIITRGDRGMAVFDGRILTGIPGIQVLGPVDPVGAGDTAVSAIAALLGAGASLAEAATIANIATSVTVRKLRQTGTASPEEILDVGATPDYVYRPELAEDPRSAQCLPGTDIEIISEDISRGRIAHAVFDHDGTISTLREGWEAVMEPMMVRAIPGKAYQSAAEEDYHRVAGRVRTYIDQSTGIQTILQMEALADMVRHFGFVHEEAVLEAQGYKDVYNRALMERINERIRRVENGELNTDDWCVKGAVTFLRQLHERGVKLYLASGTDEQDVVNEARILGYAELFEGRIYGAVSDFSKYSKKMVIDRIIRENNLSGPELLCLGDGPVELRETKKRGGIAVGIASDEVRRFGLNIDKRARLVRAGADLIVPDFSQAQQLFAYLF